MPKDNMTLKAGQYQDVSGLTPREEVESDDLEGDVTDTASITLRDSILSLYGSSLDEDVHTLSTEETVEDLMDKSMTMLNEILNDESPREPQEQFERIDKTLNRALDTINNSKDLDIETKTYLKGDIEQFRKEVDYQRRIYLRESSDTEESTLHLGDYIIKDEGDHVAIYDEEGNFIQSNSTKSEAVYDIDHGLVGCRKSDTQDPHGKDIAWDGYDY